MNSSKKGSMSLRQQLTAMRRVLGYMLRGYYHHPRIGLPYGCHDPC